MYCILLHLKSLEEEEIVCGRKRPNSAFITSGTTSVAEHGVGLCKVTRLDSTAPLSHPRGSLVGLGGAMRHFPALPMPPPTLNRPADTGFSFPLPSFPWLLCGLVGPI